MSFMLENFAAAKVRRRARVKKSVQPRNPAVKVSQI